MSTQRFTPEFKEEAAKQVRDRGYGVPEVAARIGVSAHSVYKWVKAASPDKSEQQSKELLEAKSEILRLRAQVRRAEEERDLLKSPAVLCQGSRVKYGFMIEHWAEYLITLTCRVLRVARADFYGRPRESVSSRAREDARLLVLIRHSHAASNGVYGARRVFCDLREIGEHCGLNRVERIKRTHKIQAVSGYKTPGTIAGRPSIIAPNHLQHEFTVDAPNKVWGTDITYIRTWQGWLYLAVVLDLYARKVVGWSMKASLSRELVLDALLMAVWRRKPDRPVIVHSDQGS